MLFRTSFLIIFRTQTFAGSKFFFSSFCPHLPRLNMSWNAIIKSSFMFFDFMRYVKCMIMPHVNFVFLIPSRTIYILLAVVKTEKDWVSKLLNSHAHIHCDTVACRNDIGTWPRLPFTPSFWPLLQTLWLALRYENIDRLRQNFSMLLGFVWNCASSLFVRIELLALKISSIWGEGKFDVFMKTRTDQVEILI